VRRVLEGHVAEDELADEIVDPGLVDLVAKELRHRFRRSGDAAPQFLQVGEIVGALAEHG